MPAFSLSDDSVSTNRIAVLNTLIHSTLSQEVLSKSTTKVSAENYLNSTQIVIPQ